MPKTDTPAPEGDLMARLEEVARHDWRMSILAHTPDTAKEAAATIRALQAKIDEWFLRNQETIDRAEAAEAAALRARPPVEGGNYNPAWTHGEPGDDHTKALLEAQGARMRPDGSYFWPDGREAFPARALPTEGEVGELVRELRAFCDRYDDPDYEGLSDDEQLAVNEIAERMESAAAALERLSRRVAELEARLDVLDTEYGAIEEEKHLLEEDVPR